MLRTDGIVREFGAWFVLVSGGVVMLRRVAPCVDPVRVVVGCVRG